MKEGFLEKFKRAYQQDAEKSSEKKERGHNVHVKFLFTRHELPVKQPDGLSADQVKPEGLEKARKVGSEEDSKHVLITGSRSVHRARETAEAYREGIVENDLVEVINKEGVTNSKTREHGIYALPDLNPVQNIATILKPIFAEGKKLVQEGKLEKSKLEAWGISRFMELPENDFVEAGVQTPREIASELAHRLNSGVKMSGKLFEDLNVKVNNFTHGPKIECLLKFVLQQTEKTGYDSLDEIGGAISPGENVEFSIERDEKGDLKPITIHFRGQTYSFDMETFHRLVTEYHEKK